MLKLWLEAMRKNAATVPGESRVANFANDVQMVSRSLVTSDNNRLAISHSLLLPVAIGSAGAWKCAIDVAQKMIK